MVSRTLLIALMVGIVSIPAHAQGESKGKAALGLPEFILYFGKPKTVYYEPSATFYLDPKNALNPGPLSERASFWVTGPQASEVEFKIFRGGSERRFKPGIYKGATQYSNSGYGIDFSIDGYASCTFDSRLEGDFYINSVRYDEKGTLRDFDAIWIADCDKNGAVDPNIVGRVALGEPSRRLKALTREQFIAETFDDLKSKLGLTEKDVGAYAAPKITDHSE